MNPRASALGLYDMPSPSTPFHLTVRNAIEKHRAGERLPVFLSTHRCTTENPQR